MHTDTVSYVPTLTDQLHVYVCVHALSSVLFLLPLPLPLSPPLSLYLSPSSHFLPPSLTPYGVSHISPSSPAFTHTYTHAHIPFLCPLPHLLHLSLSLCAHFLLLSLHPHILPNTYPPSHWTRMAAQGGCRVHEAWCTYMYST